MCRSAPLWQWVGAHERNLNGVRDYYHQTTQTKHTQNQRHLPPQKILWYIIYFMILWLQFQFKKKIYCNECFLLWLYMSSAVGSVLRDSWNGCYVLWILHGSQMDRIKLNCNELWKFSEVGSGITYFGEK